MSEQNPRTPGFLQRDPTSLYPPANAGTRSLLYQKYSRDGNPLFAFRRRETLDDDAASESYSCLADVDDDEVRSMYRLGGVAGNTSVTEFDESNLPPSGFFEDDDNYTEEEILWNNHFMHGSNPIKRRGASVKVTFNGTHTFEVSDCTGTRKALFVGINYFNTDHEFPHGIEQSYALQVFLQQNYDIPADNVLSLTDSTSEPDWMPTKDNILNGLRWLIAGAKPGDALFFYYCGHGNSPKATEETPGGAIYSMDGCLITIDDVFAIVYAMLPAGCHLALTFDADIGSPSVLPCEYTVDTNQNPLVSVSSDSELQSIADNLISATCEVPTEHKHVLRPFQSNSEESITTLNSSIADVFLFTCKPNMQSPETKFISQALMTTLSEDLHPTFQILLDSMSTSLVDQSFKICTGRPIEKESIFLL